MTAIGRQFDFHDVIYNIQPCNVDNRWRNVAFTTNGHLVKTRVKGNSNTLLMMAKLLLTLKGPFIV